MACDTPCPAGTDWSGGLAAGSTLGAVASIGVLIRLRGGVGTAPSGVPSGIDMLSPFQYAVSMGTLYIGTAMAALSGCITAGSKEMDLFGCVLLAMVTAIGGGTLRDMVLGNRVYWMADQTHATIAIIVAVIAFAVWPKLVEIGFKDTHLAFLWSDAIGMASSSIIGAHTGLEATDSALVGIVSGVMTATAGGVVRDLLCLERPRVLHSSRSMYATPALLGAAAFTLMRRLRSAYPALMPAWATAVVPWAIALLLRAAAWTYRLALPRWARKKKSFSAINVFADPAKRQAAEYEIKVAQAEQGGAAERQSTRKRA